MNVLELFAGSRSFSKVAEKLGCSTYTTDLEPFDKIDQVCSIFDFACDKVPFTPDIIWCSPPCRTFSIASCSTHFNKDEDVGFYPKTEDAKVGLEIITKMQEIIAHFGDKNPDLIFIIENPRGLLRKMPEMDKYNKYRNTIWYCQYHTEEDDLKRAKPTDIWSNADWKPRPVCKNGNPDCNHERAPRGSKTGTQGLKGSYERSKVPSALCEEILRSILEF